jgi:hypothetical protein
VDAGEAMLPIRARDAFMKMSGGDRVFIDVDVGARSAYDRRIGAGPNAAGDGTTPEGPAK